MEITKELLLQTHNIIYDKTINIGDEIVVNNTTIKLTKGGNGCRSIELPEVTFMEQNTYKSTSYASLVKKGWKITWGIRKGNWTIVIQNPEGEYTRIYNGNQVL